MSVAFLFMFGIFFVNHITQRVLYAKYLRKKQYTKTTYAKNFDIVVSLHITLKEPVPFFQSVPFEIAFHCAFVPVYFISVRFWHPLNTFFSIFVIELGMVIDARFAQPKNASLLIVVTELGIVTDVRLLQNANAPCLIVVIELGIFTDVRFLHPENASTPISLTESEIVMDVRFLQPENALSPMAVTESEIVKFFSFLPAG